jgi:hypothetical protein
LENKLITRHKLYIGLLAIVLSFSAVVTQAGGVRQDAKAIEVLKQMAAHKSSLDQVTISGITFTDARLGGGLMVSNSEEVRVSINRPNSMHISSFDGETQKSLYFHKGQLTVHNATSNLYAQASIPENIEAAAEFALEELGVEAPLLDLIYKDASVHLINSDEAILYLTDKARVGGADCHHLAIRGAEVDVQLWVEEGDRTVVRKIMIMSKWEGGSPRFMANLDWDTSPKFEPGLFEFKAPKDAIKIEFVTESSER